MALLERCSGELANNEKSLGVVVVQKAKPFSAVGLHASSPSLRLRAESLPPKLTMAVELGTLACCLLPCAQLGLATAATLTARSKKVARPLQSPEGT